MATKTLWLSICAAGRFSIFTALHDLLMAREMGLYALKSGDCPAKGRKKRAC
jgi:hypothetical protein